MVLPPSNFGLTVKKNIYNYPPYQKALSDSGYSHKLEYDQNANVKKANSKQKRRRNRKTTYFNPPYSLNAKHNLGPSFKRLVAEGFPKGHHPLHKIFNKNTLKLSYKYMPNIGKIISAHNSKMLREEQVKEAV